MIEKIREATKLLTANLLLFSTIVLTVWLPGSILLVFLRLYVGGDELDIFVREMRVSNAIELAFGPLYMGAVLHAASQLKQGLQVNYRESMTRGAHRSFKLLGTRILAGLIVLAGLIAFVIPGIVLALHFALVDAVVVLEGVAAGDALKRSIKLTEGRRWSILGAIILTWIGLFIVLTPMSVIPYIISISLGGSGENFILEVWYGCIGNILLLLPFLVLFLFYWEAKES